MNNNILYFLVQAIHQCETEFKTNKNIINHEYIINHWWPDLMLRLYSGLTISEALQKITIEESKNILKYLNKIHYIKHHGELDKILSCYYPLDYKGIFVEIGSGHWEILNDSLYFEKNQWTCYCFEPNPLYYEELLKNRTHVYNIALSNQDIDNVNFYLYNTNFKYGISQMAGSGLSKLQHDYAHLDNSPIFNKIIKVNQRKLSNVLPKNIKIDIMTIDVEEHEYNVLQGIDFNIHAPDIMVLENTFENIQCRSFLYDLSYELINRIGINDIFKKSNFVPKIFI